MTYINWWSPYKYDKMSTPYPLRSIFKGRISDNKINFHVRFNKKRGYLFYQERGFIGLFYLKRGEKNAE